LSCAGDVATREAHENLPTAEWRVDRAKTIRSSHPPSPWEKHRADSPEVKDRVRSSLKRWSVGAETRIYYSAIQLFIAATLQRSSILAMQHFVLRISR